MTRDELEAILAGKEREAGQKGQRRPHLHPCTQGCGVPEPCEDRTCTYPPGDRSLSCTQRPYRLLGIKGARYSPERLREMQSEPGRSA